MQCEDLLVYLSDYIDNDLDEELVAVAQQHLATCQNCKVVLNTTEKTIHLYRKYRTRTIPAQRRGKLFDALQTAFLEKTKKAS